MRAGFTLIEALLALLIFEVAALAFAASSSLVARDLTVAARYSRARFLAEERVAVLRARGCAGAMAGSAKHPGIEEHYAVVAAGRLRESVDSVTIELPLGRRAAIVVRAWDLCDD